MKESVVNPEDGAGEIFVYALLVIFSAIVLGCMSFYLNSKIGLNKINVSRRTRLEIEKNLIQLEKDMQFLCNDDNDSESSIAWLEEKYATEELSIKDVSTGININTFGSWFLDDKAIVKFLLRENVSREKYKENIGRNHIYKNMSEIPDSFTEQAKDNMSFYGWGISFFPDSAVVSQILESGGRYKEDWFPAVNSMPPMNINFIHHELLVAILGMKEICVVNVEDKALALEYLLQSNRTVTDREIAKCLGINEDNSFFKIVGRKTCMWNIIENISGRRLSVIFGAIPQKENQRKVNEYKILDWRIL